MITTLQGCSGLSAVSSALGLFTEDKGLSVDTEIIIGDKDETIQVGNRTGVVNNNADAININEVDYFLILVAILGWMLPSPTEMWRGLVNLIKR